MHLRFLEFDLSEDTDGLRSWDALASPAAAHTPALLSEVRRLVQHVSQRLGPAGAMDEGHLWDMDLQIDDEGGHALSLEEVPSPCRRISVALSLSGGNELADALSAFAGV